MCHGSCGLDKYATGHEGLSDAPFRASFVGITDVAIFAPDAMEKREH